MRDGEATRERIRREAMRLAVERGVEAVSVRDIAAAVGMKASNLYAHWRSREELLRELFADGYAEYGRALADVRPGPVRERLPAMVRLICRLHDEDTVRFRFLLLTQHAAMAAVEAGRTPVDVVQAALADAMATGELPARDPALMAAAVVGIVLQAATFHLYGRVPQPMAALADELAAACLRALG